MSEREHILSLMKEAKLYQGQGLLEESRDKYRMVLEAVEANERFRNRDELIQTIRKKIQAVEKDLEEVEEAPLTAEVSEDLQELIRKLFAFSKDKETAAAEKAVALAKFGQYEQALAEFNRLMEKGVMPVDAAKNILACHMKYGSPDAAIAQYQRWVSREILSKEKLAEIYAYLGRMLERKNLKHKLPAEAPGRRSRKKTGEEADDDGMIDISTVSLKLETGPLKGQSVELDVASQSGNLVSILVPGGKKELIDSFKLGVRFTEMQCYSPTAVFRCEGTAFGKTKLESGPKRGSYVLDIMINEE